MSICSVELSWIRGAGKNENILAHCVHQDEIAIAASNAFSTVVTNAHVTNAGGDLVARIVTNDLGCHVAMGTSPDATSTDQNDDPKVSSARRWVPPGGELIVSMSVGYKVAVHS